MLSMCMHRPTCKRWSLPRRRTWRCAMWTPHSASTHSQPWWVAQTACTHSITTVVSHYYQLGYNDILLISRPELKIQREVLDCSTYHAATPRFRLNISVSIDPRLSKSKFWNVWKLFLLVSFSPGLIRLNMLIDKSILFQNHWLDLHQNVGA